MKNNSAENFDSLFEKKKHGYKIFIILFFLILIGIVGIYTYFTVGAVRSTMESAKTEVQGATPVNPSLIGLMKNKAWVESRLKMATDDSIGMSIDLEQNEIQLLLKGVVIMKSKIKESSISGFFKRMDGNVYFNIFGSPLTIRHLESSIAKNPLKVIQAPTTADTAVVIVTAKDSLQKGKNSPPKENIYWTVKLDHNIELNIQGIDSITKAQNKYKLGKGFEFQRDLKNIKSSFEHIIKFQKPNYTPEILISIPENEAKAILRAIPKNASITIRI